MPLTQKENSPDCDPESKPDTELYWLELAEENIEDLSSKPLEVENETECLLGETGFEVRVGDADADWMGGEAGGVYRGVLVWEASNKPGAIRGLEAAPIM